MVIYARSVSFSGSIGGTERSPLLGSRILNAEATSAIDPDDQSEAVQSLLGHKSHSFSDTSTWKAELRLLFSYAIPLIGTYLLQYAYSVVTIYVAGHLGSDILAAASIGVTTMNIIGFTFFEGMATALDTLCAQAYGSGNLKGVGLHVQRMLLLMGATAIPVGAFWICSPWILTLFVKQEHLARMAGRFLQISLIGLPGYASFEALKRFAQAQGEFNASLIVLVICVPVNILLNWLLCFKLNWALEGAALAQALTNDLRPLIFMFIMLVWNRWTLQCWGGFSRDAFKRWGPMVGMSLAGATQNMSEWFAFELLTFSSSYISTEHIAAQTILATCSILVWHIPFSVSIANSTRVGHLVGSGALKNAQRVITFYAAVFICIGILDGILLFLFRHIIPKIFTDDPKVRAILVHTLPLVAAFQFVDALLCGLSGTLRGFGRQSIAAWASFLTNYLCSVPLALYLGLGPPRLELIGFWSALQCGMLILALIQAGSIKLINWQKCVEDARARSD